MIIQFDSLDFMEAALSLGIDSEVADKLTAAFITHNDCERGLIPRDRYVLAAERIIMIWHQWLKKRITTEEMGRRVMRVDFMF